MGPPLEPPGGRRARRRNIRLVKRLRRRRRGRSSGRRLLRRGGSSSVDRRSIVPMVRRTGAPSSRRPGGLPRLRDVETEAKFLLDGPREAQELLAALAVKGSPQVESLEDAYYDTRDRALLSAGWAYRVRSRGDGPSEATLKAIAGPTSDGIYRREELTEALASPDPQPSLLRDGRVRKTLLSWVGAGPLEPLARVKTARSTWRVAPRRGLEVQASIDRTTASSGRARRQWTEVEIELSGGSDAAFARLVADVIRRTGRRPVA